MKTEIIDNRPAPDRVTAMLSAYRSANDNDEIEIRAGSTTGGQPALLLSIGAGVHVFTDSEANRVVKVLDSAISAYPSQFGSEGITSLRDGIVSALAAIRRAKP